MSYTHYHNHEPNPLQDRLRGRADFLRDIGRIKDAELMEEAAALLDFCRMSMDMATAEGK